MNKLKEICLFLLLKNIEKLQNNEQFKQDLQKYNITDFELLGRGIKSGKNAGLIMKLTYNNKIQYIEINPTSKKEPCDKYTTIDEDELILTSSEKKSKEKRKLSNFEEERKNSNIKISYVAEEVLDN